MLLHEDTEMEEAALSGELTVCVPVSVWLAEGECEPVITAYSNVWDICEKFEESFGKCPFDENALLWLDSQILPIMHGAGYCTDIKNNRVIKEYRMSEMSAAVTEYSGGAVIIKSTAEAEGLPCLCLHKPEMDDEDEADACAVVIRDGAVCAVAGLNDFFTDDTYEIYVETAKDYRRQGFGTAAVAALTKYLTGLGHTVGYKCGEDNRASAGIAEKLGMTLSGRRYDMVYYAQE